MKILKTIAAKLLIGENKNHAAHKNETFQPCQPVKSHTMAPHNPITKTSDTQEIKQKNMSCEWDYIELAPSSRAGYKTETTTTTRYKDGRATKVNSYSYDVSPSQSKGTLIAYRTYSFPYPKLRANGLSPVVVMDAFYYDYKTKKLLNYSSGLVNNIKSDSLQLGAFSLAHRKIKNNSVKYELPKPPTNWDELKEWAKKTPAITIKTEQLKWSVVNVSREDISNALDVCIQECLSPLDFMETYIENETYLTTIELKSKTGQVWAFRGLTYGQPKTRVKTIKSFLKSILPAMDVS